MNNDTICDICGYRYGQHSNATSQCPIIRNGKIAGFSNVTFTPCSPPKNNIDLLFPTVHKLQAQVGELQLQMQKLTTGQRDDERSSLLQQRDDAQAKLASVREERDEAARLSHHYRNERDAALSKLSEEKNKTAKSIPFDFLMKQGVSESLRLKLKSIDVFKNLTPDEVWGLCKGITDVIAEPLQIIEPATTVREALNHLTTADERLVRHHIDTLRAELNQARQEMREAQHSQHINDTSTIHMRLVAVEAELVSARKENASLQQSAIRYCDQRDEANARAARAEAERDEAKRCMVVALGQARLAADRAEKAEACLHKLANSMRALIGNHPQAPDGFGVRQIAPGDVTQKLWENAGAVLSESEEVIRTSRSERT